MMRPAKILVFQTAFMGDVILTLPLVQVLSSQLGGASIDVVAIPVAAQILQNHPAINEVIVYDKRGNDRGLAGFLVLVRKLSSARYDLVIMPHRSIRSAFIGWFAHIPRRIGFSNSAGRFLFTDIVKYDKKSHEIKRNLSLLNPLRIQFPAAELPALYPGGGDRRVIEQLLHSHPLIDPDNMIAVAPGSVWATKRWLADRFVEFGRKMTEERFSLILIGGSEDVPLCRQIEEKIDSLHVLNAAGKLTPLQSAEIIRRCRAAVCNDSAPMHMAVALRTPVVAIFGATVPEFGFAPLGARDQIVETKGLACRPCSIHGGDVCPIGTFECMMKISSDAVVERVHAILSGVRSEA